MTPEDHAIVAHQITERTLRKDIAATKHRLMALTDALEVHVAQRAEKIAGTAEFIRSLRTAAAGQDVDP